MASDNDGRATRNGIGNETRPIRLCAGDSYESHAWYNLTAIGGKACYLKIAKCPADLSAEFRKRISGDISQVHRIYFSFLIGPPSRESTRVFFHA
jgi:hypothetical protein